MAGGFNLGSLSEPIDAYMGVVGEGHDITLVEGNFGVPYDPSEIISINKDAQLIRIGDIDEHRKISSNIGPNIPTDIQNKTKQYLQDLLFQQQK